MIKNIAWAALALMLCGTAKAAEQPTFEIGYGSYSVVGLLVTSGTVVQINSSRPTNFNASVAGYRIVNQDASSAIWVGGVNVSTQPAVITAANIANLGEKVASGQSAPYPFNKDRTLSASPLTPLYAKGADACGAVGCLISVFWFGY